MDIRKFFSPSSGSKKPGNSSVKEASTSKKNEETKTKGGKPLKSPADATQKKSKTPPVIKKDKKLRTSPRKQYSFESDDDVEIVENPSDEDVIKNSQDSLKGKTKINESLPKKSLTKLNSPKKVQEKNRNKNKADETKGEKVPEKLDQRKKCVVSNLNFDLIEIESVTSNDSKNSKTNSQNRTAGKETEKNKNGNVRKNKVLNENKQDNEVRRSPRKQFSHTKSAEKTKRKHKQISSDDDEDNFKSEAGSDNTESEEVIATSRKRARSSSTKLAKKTTRILDSDSEEDPLPKEKPKAKRKKKDTVTYVDDSDGEKSVTALDKFVIHNAKPLVREEKTKKSNTEVLKPVNVSDFFGASSASRSNRVTAAGKRKHEGVKEVDVVDVDLTFDEEMHDDEDFQKTLDQLDGPNVKKVKPSEIKAVEPGSLSSKLSAKVKSQLSPTKGSLASANSNNNKSLSKSPARGTPKSPDKKSPVKKGSLYNMEITRETKLDSTEVKVETTPQNTKPLMKGELTPQNSKHSTPATKSGSDKRQTGSEKKDDDGFGSKRSAGFKAFKERGGPLALGSKEIPEGAENCLEGLTFVITGVLDCIERDDTKSLIEKHGGKVTGNVSGRTSYVVVGRDPGESKLTKADKLKVKQLDEDQLFNLIRTLPGKTSKYEIQAKEQFKKEASAKKALEKKVTPNKLDAFRSVKEKTTPSTPSPVKQKATLFTQLKDTSETNATLPASTKLLSQSLSQDACDAAANQPQSLLWVDKHKPTSLKSIIGQQGDKSNAKKLLNWLTSWHENVISKGLKPPSGFFGKGDGAGNRAALLSGPPGIGKTTTATLVCKEAKFSYVELNASDCRSKRSLKEVVSESLNNQTLVDYMGDNSSGAAPSGQSHCLIMDEVDGMAGNEDRGGLQELVLLIKNTKIPIICICNDRNSMKMRTLSNYCLDLRFQRPRVEQIKGAMMSLAFKEGLKIPPAALNEIIIASNHDIRQIIHNMSMWSASDKTMTFEQVKSDAAKAQKDIKLGPFDVCRKVFVDDEETRKMTINDKSDLFFHDYSFGPLFVHENYPNIIPKLAKGNHTRHLSCLARTIDSLCDGDLIDKLVRRDGNWSLLPIQAMFASVIPGELMRGSFPQMSAFPQWLGKFSSTNKTHRILQELGLHMRLQTSCDKRGLTLDYLPALRTSLTSPLTTNGAEGVPDVIKVMDDYDIIKEDFDNILEVTKWPNSFDPMSKLDSKTKAAFTRQYNKEIHLTPYATGSINKKRTRGATMEEEEVALEGEGEDQTTAAEVESEKEEEESLEENTMIKAKKTSSKGKKISEQKAGGSGKGKGGGKKK